MAKKAGAGRPDLVEAAFALIAEAGWRGWSTAALAERSGLSLVDIHAELPTPATLARRLGERLDRAMLDLPKSDLDGLSPRERLFELLMRRFDAMAPLKPGLRRMVREAREPELLCAAFANLDRMAGWLLDLAGLPHQGLRGRLGRRALMLAYARVFQVWLGDETEDLATTLAELDRRLDQLKRLAGLGDQIFAPFSRRSA